MGVTKNKIYSFLISWQKYKRGTCLNQVEIWCFFYVHTFLMVFLKNLQILLENIGVRYNFNVKVWLYAYCLQLYFKRESYTQLFSSEFWRNLKNTFLWEFSWVSASDLICDIFKLDKNMNVSFLFTLFLQKK